MTYDERQMAVTLVCCLQCRRALYMPVLRLPCVQCEGTAFVAITPDRWSASVWSGSVNAAGRRCVTDLAGVLMDDDG